MKLFKIGILDVNEKTGEVVLIHEAKDNEKFILNDDKRLCLENNSLSIIPSRRLREREAIQH